MTFHVPPALHEGRHRLSGDRDRDVCPPRRWRCPSIVGVKAIVVAVVPPVIVIAGATVSTVSLWVKVAQFPAASKTPRITPVRAVGEDVRRSRYQLPSAPTMAVSVSSARSR